MTNQNYPLVIPSKTQDRPWESLRAVSLRAVSLRAVSLRAKLYVCTDEVHRNVAKMTNETFDPGY
jgi:hypothetical protein